MLVIVLRMENGQELDEGLKADLNRRNRGLPDFKRVGGYLVWDKDFPRTASMKIKRSELAVELGKHRDRLAVVQL